MTQENGSTVTFPLSTNTNITSIGGTCGTLSGDSTTVSLTVNASPTVPATATCTSGNWTLTLTTAISAEGSYAFVASQSDAAGNTGTSTSKTVTVDKTAPLVAVTQVNGTNRTFPFATNTAITSVGGTCGKRQGTPAP